jgi:hypothetical protein
LSVFVSGSYVYATSYDRDALEIIGVFPPPVTGLSEMNQTKITISPNPTEHTLLLYGINDDVLEAQINDEVGRNFLAILEKTDEGYTTNVEQLSIGTYILVIKSKKGSQKMRFVKR